MKEKYLHIKNWVYKHPKKVYKYSMIIILISFAFTILQYIFFPPQFTFKTLAPSMYGKSDKYKDEIKVDEKKMEKIVKELLILKEKKKRKEFTSEDKIRVQYLYNEYQKMKYNNGTKKN